jgi:integrase
VRTRKGGRIVAKAHLLTAIFVKQCRKPGVYRDGQGLLLRVDQSGAKRWVLRVTIRGHRRDVGLGSAGAISLQNARERAADLRKAAREGRDPVAAQRATRSTIPTFAEAARVAHEQHREGWANGKHVEQWINTLRDHAFPLIGGKLVSEITAGDVLDVLSPIWLSKPETARRVRQRIRLVLERARVAGHQDGINPADAVGAGLPRQSRKTEHFASVPYVEVPELLRRSRVSSGSGLVRLAFEFLVLTAARTGEVIGARWVEIDFREATWTIPASRMKARREHRVPLNPRCIEILRLAHELQPKSELIFPGRRGKPLSNMALAMFLRRLGRDETVHGFRSSFRDWAAESGFSHEVCEAALAHVVENKVERAYRRTDLFERRRQVMMAWSSFLTMDRIARNIVVSEHASSSAVDNQPCAASATSGRYPQVN